MGSSASGGPGFMLVLSGTRGSGVDSVHSNTRRGSRTSDASTPEPSWNRAAKALHSLDKGTGRSRFIRTWINRNHGSLKVFWTSIVSHVFNFIFFNWTGNSPKLKVFIWCCLFGLSGPTCHHFLRVKLCPANKLTLNWHKRTKPKRLTKLQERSFPHVTNSNSRFD